VMFIQASLKRNRNCTISKVLVQRKVRWDVTPCNSEYRPYRLFDRIYCFHLQGDRGRRGKRFITCSITFCNTVISKAADV
jgi:hypothetical protein